MNQKDETAAWLTEWLAEHTDAIEHLSGSGTDLDELIDDHALLTKAIRYWSGKSEERVEEYRFLAKELQQEIVALVRRKLTCLIRRQLS